MKIYKWHQVSFEIAVNRLKQFFIPSFIKMNFIQPRMNNLGIIVSQIDLFDTNAKY